MRDKKLSQVIAETDKQKERENRKVFDIRDILTVTTGKLLTKKISEDDNGIINLYKILKYMTGEAPFTHSLGRFAEECKPVILKLYPEIEQAGSGDALKILDRLFTDNADSQIAIDKWIKYLYSTYNIKGEYSFTEIVRNHKVIDPIVELQGKLQDKVEPIKFFELSITIRAGSIDDIIGLIPRVTGDFISGDERVGSWCGDESNYEFNLSEK